MATTTDPMVAAARDRTGVPDAYGSEPLDVRELGPPEPLVRTLEALVDLDDETALVQVNDRVPRHLYPELDDRGFAWETVTVDDAVVTVVWRP